MTCNARGSLLIGILLAGAILMRDGHTRLLLVEEEEKRSRGQLHVLAVGINAYRHPTLAKVGLRLCVKDAADVAATLQARGRAPFDDVRVRTLLDAQATREALEGALTDLIRAAGPADTVVLTFSGAALWPETVRCDPAAIVEVRPAFERAYLATVDSDPENPAETAVPFAAVANRLKQCSARNLLVLLDTPGEEEGADLFLRAFREEGSHRNAVVMINDGGGFEREGDPNGLLTLAVLEGLSGKADAGAPPDGTVTARELDAFLYTRVRQLLKVHPGAPVPYISGVRGKDFPLAAVEAGPAPAGDPAPPVIEITAPVFRSAKLVVEEATLLIEGRVTASGPAAGLTVDVAGTPVTVSAAGVFTRSVSVPVGETLVPVRARDAAGRESQTVLIVQRRTPSTEVLAGPLSSLWEGRLHAVLIATDVYDRHWMKLNNAVADAEAFRKVLENSYGLAPAPAGAAHGPNTTLLYGKTREELRAALNGLVRRFREDRNALDKRDQMVVFIAGHGTVDEGMHEGYLVTKDSGPDLSTALSLTELQQRLDNIQCPRMLVILDACYGGAFDKTVFGKPGGNCDPATVQDEAPRSAPNPDYIRRSLKKRSRLFLASGRFSEVSDGKRGENSPFARRLLAAMEKGGQQPGLCEYEDMVAAVKQLNPEPHWGRFVYAGTEDSFILFRK